MSLNPREYDLAELRRMADPGETDAADDQPSDSEGDAAPDARGPTAPQGVAPEPRGPPPEDRLELARLQRAVGRLDRPYLRDLPPGYDAQEEALAWIDELLAHAGYWATEDALAYYREIGWISGRVERQLRTHAEELADHRRDGYGPVDPAYHRRSLLHVARLATRARRGPPRR